MSAIDFDCEGTKTLLNTGHCLRNLLFFVCVQTADARKHSRFTGFFSLGS